MVLETLGVAAGVFGHIKSKKWVSRRLRYTDVIEKRYAAVGAGVATGGAAAAAVAAVGVLPFVAAPVLPAIIVGLGVGSGVAVGVKKARSSTRS